MSDTADAADRSGVKADLIAEVARSATTFWELELTSGLDAGDTSLRDPDTGYIYILPRPNPEQPFANWSEIDDDDVVVVDRGGMVVRTNGLQPTVELQTHLGIYDAVTRCAGHRPQPRRVVADLFGHAMGHPDLHVGDVPRRRSRSDQVCAVGWRGDARSGAPGRGGPRSPLEGGVAAVAPGRRCASVRRSRRRSTWPAWWSGRRGRRRSSGFSAGHRR